MKKTVSKKIAVILSVIMLFALAVSVSAAFVPTCQNCHATMRWQIGMGPTCYVDSCKEAVNYYVCPSCGQEELICMANHHQILIPGGGK